MTDKGKAAYPDRRARFDAAFALAMLPVGVILGLFAAVALITLLVGAVFALISAPGRLPLWCFAAGAACAWIAVTAIEVVSAFDWRPLPRVIAVIVIVVATCPGWW